MRHKELKGYACTGILEAKTSAGTGTGNTVSDINKNGTTNQTISWTPTSTGTYYYQCSLHGEMVGTITIQ